MLFCHVHPRRRCLPLRPNLRSDLLALLRAAYRLLRRSLCPGPQGHGVVGGGRDRLPNADLRPAIDSTATELC